jgi:hypothetical protein
MHVAGYMNPADPYLTIEGFFFFPEPQMSTSWTVFISRRYRGSYETQNLSITDFIARHS